MNTNTMFPSKFLKAADLQGKTVEVKIDRVILEEVGQGADAEDKPILYFVGKEKGLVLNKTNATMIASAYGDETDNWAGTVVHIYPDKTSFRGEIVDCLRVKIPSAAPSVEDPEVPF